MKTKRIHRILFLIPLVPLTLLALAAGEQQPAHPKPLPAKPPKAPSLEFTGPREGWPPRPRDQANVKEVPWTETAGGLTEQRAEQLRKAALRDASVRRLLGERFAYITTDTIEPEKDRRPQPGEALQTRVTFYSYTRNTAIEVRMKGEKVEAAEEQKRFQPPEGVEEIKAAIALAQKDRRLQDKLQGLVGHAILAYPRKDQPGHGHRVLYVSFSKEEDDHPRYVALVDLTDRKVLSAGAAGRN